MLFSPTEANSLRMISSCASRSSGGVWFSLPHRVRARMRAAASSGSSEAYSAPDSIFSRSVMASPPVSLLLHSSGGTLYYTRPVAGSKYPPAVKIFFFFRCSEKAHPFGRKEPRRGQTPGLL